MFICVKDWEKREVRRQDVIPWWQCQRLWTCKVIWIEHLVLIPLICLPERK